MSDYLLDNCLYFTANKLSRVITKLAEEEFKKTGLTPNYAFVILTVKANPGISPSLIAEKLHIAPSTITRFVDKLILKNLVTREFKGKSSLINITDEGNDLLSTIEECWKNLYVKYSEILGYENGNELTKIVNEAANILE